MHFAFSREGPTGTVPGTAAGAGGTAAPDGGVRAVPERVAVGWGVTRWHWRTWGVCGGAVGRGRVVRGAVERAAPHEGSADAW